MVSCESNDISPLNEKQTIAQSNLRAPLPVIQFGLHPYKPRTDCKSGWGACGGRLIVLGFEVFITDVNGTGTTLEDNGEFFLKMVFESDPFPNENDFEVGNDVLMSQEICDLYQASQVQLVPGNYDLTINSENKREVVVPITIQY